MRKTIKITQMVLKEMKLIYYNNEKYEIDWMGYLITEENKPSYHHIKKIEEIKKENKDYKATLENGAYLGKISHQKLHEIEMIDYDLYICWNDLFKLINNMGIYPIDDIWDTIYKLQEITEKEIKEHKNSKRLIK